MKRFLVIFLFILFTFQISACSNQESVAPDTHSQATNDRFRAGEVKEYKGKLLSPAVGPRDNSILGVQHIDISKYSLKIEGQVETPVVMTYAEVLKLTPYERLITLHCVEGWSATMLWKGVLLEDLISRATPKLEAVTVIFHSQDGYTTSLPWSVIKEKKLILAYNANNIALPPEMGYPFIVVAEDKLGYKWARWVTSIELSNDAEYKGYWEQRGYDNKADVKK